MGLFKIQNKETQQPVKQDNSYEAKVKSQQAQEEKQLFEEPKQEDGV
jgi:hypothetical protein